MAAAAGNDDSATRSTSVGPPAAVLLPELEDERLCPSLWRKRVGRVFLKKWQGKLLIVREGHFAILAASVGSDING
jgi:hypothetical protein